METSDKLKLVYLTWKLPNGNERCSESFFQSGIKVMIDRILRDPDNLGAYNFQDHEVK